MQKNPYTRKHDSAATHNLRNSDSLWTQWRITTVTLSSRRVKYGTPRESTTFIYPYMCHSNWEGGTEKLIWISYISYSEAIDKNEGG